MTDGAASSSSSATTPATSTPAPPPSPTPVEPPSGVRAVIFAVMVARDALQQRPFADLLKHYGELVQKEKVLSEKCGVLEREVSNLRSDNELLRRGKDPVKLQAPSELESSALQQLIAKLRTDLTESYKRNSENAREMLAINAEKAELTAKAAAKDKDFIESKQKISEIEAAKRKVDAELQEKEVTIAVLRGELQSLQIDNVKQQDAVKRLSADKATLEDRLLKKANEDASKMNEATQMMMAAKLKEQELAAKPTTPAPVPAQVFTKGASLLEASMEPQVFKVKIPTGPRKLLEGHSGDINTVTFNVNGSLLVSGGADKVIRVWDVASGIMKASMMGAAQTVTSVALSCSDDLVLGCSNDKAARVWTLQNSRLRHALTGHVDKVSCGLFADNTQKVVTGSHDRSLKVWDLGKGYCVRTIFCFSSCNDACLGTTGGTVLSAHTDKSLRFWDIRDGQCEHIIDSLHSAQLTSVCLSPDGKMALTCGKDNVLQLVDVTQFQARTSFKHDNFFCGLNATRSCCFSPDGRYVAAVSSVGSIFVWNATSGKLEKSVPQRTPASQGCAIAWHPGGYQAATSDKSVVVLWE
eukprot:TRINITY_DN491_c1_g1_i1.p1 TRINITY_DN491_c1_g1~~TRINITY_DN491_c1_g1_i1.p1  ORF type:complete len:593 (-),score=144.97 TRINITY_DN491_c1_g1_i1:45-1793(-)